MVLEEIMFLENFWKNCTWLWGVRTSGTLWKLIKIPSNYATNKGSFYKKCKYQY